RAAAAHWRGRAPDSGWQDADEILVHQTALSERLEEFTFDVERPSLRHLALSRTVRIRLCEIHGANRPASRGQRCQNSHAPRAMNAATNTIVTTSTSSAALIRRYASIENRGTATPWLRALRTRMKVIIGASSNAKTTPNKASLTQKKPLRQ